MSEPLLGQSATPPQVSIQLDDQSASPEVPQRFQTPKRRGAGAFIIALVALAGLLLWSANRQVDETSADRADVPIVAASTTVVPATVTDEAATPQSRGSVIAIDIDPHNIQTVARYGDNWLATTRSSEGVLTSSDNGLTWTLDGSDEAAGIEVLSLGESTEFAMAALVTLDGSADDELETWTRDPDGWRPLPDRSPIVVSSGRVTHTLVGDISLAVVEDRWQAPVPEVIEVLEQFVAADVAAQTCAMNRTVLADGGADYELLDCAGASVGLIAAADIEVGGKDDDLLAFTQEVLRTRTVVYVSIPGREVQIVELPPSQLILDITLTEAGFVAFILDSSEVLGNVDILYSQSFAALLIGWEAGDGPVTPFATPIQTPVRASAWSLNEVHANADGSLTVISPIGLHRGEPPFESWTLLSAGPIDPPLPGRIASSALYGDGFYMPDPRSEDFLFASPDGITWTAFQHEGANLRRMLIATDEFFTFDTVDRTIVRIDRDY